jgi:diguanylate cyclase (GGDEF)-like protein/PAS domain S-box-containing protein
LQGACQDITEKKRAEQALNNSEMRFRQLADAMPLIVWAAEPDGTIDHGNRAVSDYSGLSTLDASSQNWIKIVYPADLDYVLAAWTEAVASGRVFAVEYRIFRAADASFRWHSVQARPIKDDTGKIIKWYGTATDIHDSKLAHGEISRLASRLTTTMESITDAFFTLDREWRFTYVNREAERILGVTRNDILGTVIWDTFKKTVGSVFHHQYLRAVRDNCTVVFEDFSVLLNRWLEVRAYPSEEGLAIYFRDISKRKNAEAKVRASEERLRLILDNTLDAHIATDFSGQIIQWNRQAEVIFGWTSEEALGLRLDETIIPVAYRDAHRRGMERMNTGIGLPGAVIGRRMEIAALQRSGDEFPVELSIVPIKQDGHLIFSASIRDITKRKQSALESARINRALQLLSRCNEAVGRAENEQDLLKEICQLVTNIGGYSAAWIGYAKDDEARSIEPVAEAGSREDAAYVAGLKASWSEDEPAGLGPAGRTIRSGKPIVVDSITQDPIFSPWRDSASRRGYRSGICLPLRDKERTFGILALYSSESHPATTEEVKLLEKLADNVAFNIDGLRSKERQRRMEAAVIKIAASVSAHTGIRFFEQLTRNMTEALGAQAGFVARLLPGEPYRARTITAIIDGKVTENFDYLIEGTPCERFIHEAEWVVQDNVIDRFPRAPLPASMGARAYAGQRLDNSAGQPMGILFVLFGEPLKEPGLVSTTLQIFVARAAGELERQEADARIRDQASLLDKAQDAIIVHGLDHRVLFWNKSAERLYGWTENEALGRSVEELHFNDNAPFHEAYSKLLEFGEWTGETRQKRKDGSFLIIECHWTLVRDDDNQPKSILAINTDITQRKENEREIHQLAFYDTLTGLPNRQLLLDRLQHAIALSARRERMAALMLIDLDNFKTLNDTFGHDKGDQLLQQVGQRLLRCVGTRDTVARLGGDEFVVLLEDLGENSDDAATGAEAIGEKILRAFKQPYQLAEYEHYCTPSLGVTLFNNHAGSVDELLKQADLAMYQAKAAGRNAMRFFDPAMQSSAIARAALEVDFRQGLREKEFVLHYQPQLNSGGYVTGAEALVRWQHGQRMISPVEFIPLAEETGLIEPLGQWVLETACAQLVAWAACPETARLSMAVNVSARQLHHPDFVSHVLTVLNYTGANPLLLKLELTESLLVSDVEDTISKMIALKSRGVKFALDDFGTGYSSLSYLRRLPLDELKIDRSFIRDMLIDPDDSTIVLAIVRLAQSLGLAVIAEGVETESQRDFLADHGCHAYQGYLFSRPIPSAQFNAFIRKRRVADN